MDMKSNEGFAAFLTGKTQALTAEIQALEASDRKDEANLIKAARNIYGIYAQLLAKVDAKTYAEQFDKMLEAWQDARETAAAHADYTRVAIEDAKISALGDIRTQYAQLSPGGDSV